MKLFTYQLDNRTFIGVDREQIQDVISHYQYLVPIDEEIQETSQLELKIQNSFLPKSTEKFIYHGDGVSFEIDTNILNSVRRQVLSCQKQKWAHLWYNDIYKIDTGSNQFYLPGSVIKPLHDHWNKDSRKTLVEPKSRRRVLHGKNPRFYYQSPKKISA